MVKDPRDFHPFILDPVEYAMALVTDAANASAVVRPSFADQRKVFQSGENVFDGALISIGCIVSESFRAEFVDFDQVSASIPAQPNFRHAVRDG